MTGEQVLPQCPVGGARAGLCDAAGGDQPCIMEHFAVGNGAQSRVVGSPKKRTHRCAQRFFTPIKRRTEIGGLHSRLWRDAGGADLPTRNTKHKR